MKLYKNKAIELNANSHQSKKKKELENSLYTLTRIDNVKSQVFHYALAILLYIGA